MRSFTEACGLYETCRILLDFSGNDKELARLCFLYFFILPRMAKIWLNFINDLKEQSKKINALKSNGNQIKIKGNDKNHGDCPKVSK